MLSLFRGMTGRMHGHPELNDAEVVVHACYGLGAKVVALANRSLNPRSETWETPETAGEGLAAPIIGCSH